jgi:peptidoglycan glycosyltransferase
MNRAIRRWSVVVVLMFASLLANITWLQAIRADELNAAPNNRRALIQEFARKRGPILVDAQPAARSRRSDGVFDWLRVYPPQSLYAHATGFDSFVYGRTGVEQAENPVLSGRDESLFVRRVVDLVAGRQPEGGTVVLTLDPAAQQAATDGLQRYVGAAVALDPRTGAILALVSIPSFDPNPLANHDVPTQREAWERYTGDEEQPLLNRAFAETLPPGSVFKIVTAAAALESLEYDPDSVVPGPRTYTPPGTTVAIPNQFGTECGPGGQTTLTNALRISCNTTFAYLGVELGDEALRDQAERLGFNARTLPDYRTAISVFPEALDDPQTAQSAIGQFDVRATALQIAMVSAAVANDGVLMQPYLVAETLAPDLAPLRVTEPTEMLSGRLSPAMSEETAQGVTDMMVTVVESGTGTSAQIPGVQVAGKTGTAESGADRPPYAWFTSFAPANDPQVAVAVVIQDARGDPISGGGLAAPIARSVMAAVLAGADR